jgi:hypothetical protein
MPMRGDNFDRPMSFAPHNVFREYHFKWSAFKAWLARVAKRRRTRKEDPLPFERKWVEPDVEPYTSAFDYHDIL